MNPAKYVEEITVTDPDSNAPVELAVYKHIESGSMFAIDASFLNQCFPDNGKCPTVSDPINKGMIVQLTGDCP
jgi:hypothetical protein